MATTNDPTMPEGPGATDPAGAQVVAMFATLEQARAARDRLAQDGIPAADMDVVNRDAEAGYSSFDYERSDEGFWGAVKRFFVPDEHATLYTEGLRRGHAMLVVRPPVGQHGRVAEILEGCDPIDVDAQEQEWRKAGWTGAAPALGATATTGNAGAPRATPVARPGTATGLTDTTAATEHEAIPVVEEDVRIGKRQVDRGGVRVRSYVVERPVEQDVTLREERVEVERRPVDRPAGAVPEDAFRDRSIEVTATSEEAVVQKDARVTEEVVVRKDAQERTETVRDTTRKTEVEVEDTRTGQKTKPTTR